MKKQRLFRIITKATSLMLLLMALNATNTLAQPVTPPPNVGIYHHPIDLSKQALAIKFFPRTSYYPPLQTGMTLNVLDGYIYFDSLVRSVNVSSGQFDSLISTMYDSDTLRYAVKYLYEMIDWDPITFFQYVGYQPLFTAPYTNTSIIHVFNGILNRVSQVIPDSGAELAYMTKADAILHVTVLDTSTVQYAPGNNQVRVKCTIDDIIKGQRLTGCYDTGYQAGKGGKNPKTLSAPGDCFDFEYGLLSQSQIKDVSGYVLNRTTPWVLPGNDYIIFLNYQGIGSDSTGRYMTVMPVLSSGTIGTTSSFI